MDKGRWSGLAAIMLGLALTSTAAGQDDFRLDLDEEPSGTYVSLLGLYVMQQDADSTATIPGLGSLTGEIEFDDGYGGAVALGHRYPDAPLCVEFEYAYRTAEVDASGIDADLNTHAFMFNLLVLHEFEDSPFGLYLGIGAGAAVSVADVDEAGSEVDEEDVTFAYQVMGGISVDLSHNLELFGGVRWFDALEPEFEESGGTLEVENRSVNIEAGLRIYF